MLQALYVVYNGAKGSYEKLKLAEKTSKSVVPEEPGLRPADNKNKSVVAEKLEDSHDELRLTENKNKSVVPEEAKLRRAENKSKPVLSEKPKDNHDELMLAEKKAELTPVESKSKAVVPEELEDSRDELRSALPAKVRLGGSRVNARQWQAGIACAAGAAASVAIILTLCSSGLRDSRHLLCGLFGLLAFVTSVGYSVIFLDTYKLSQSLGRDAPFSGLIIGVSAFGYGSGSLVSWLVLKCQPALPLEGPQHILRPALLTHVSGGLGYLAVTNLAAAAATAPSALPWLPMLLLTSRFASGLGTGMVMQLGVVAISNLTSVEDRPRHMNPIWFGFTLGIGAGPLMAAACHQFHGSFAMLDEGRSLEVVGIFQVVHAALIAIAVMALFPDLRNLDRYDEEVQLFAACGKPEEISASTFNRKIVIGGSIAMSGMRGFGVSSLEAATSLMLELHYEWLPIDIGLGVAASFFTIVPIRLGYEVFRERLDAVQWMRLLTFCSFAGALLLPLCESPLWIISIDSIIFPTLCWSDSLAVGLQQQHVLPGGSLFDANHVSLWQVLAANMLGRTAGPPLARWQIHRGGFVPYVLQLALTVAVFWAVLEVIVAPRAKR